MRKFEEIPTQHRSSIALNASMLDDQPTGVGIYSLNLINSLSTFYNIDQSASLTVFTPTRRSLDKQLQIVRLPGVLKSSRYGKLAACCRFLWNTFYYPIQARRFDILVSPTTHGSFFSRNQILTIHDLISLRFNNISGHQRVYFKYLLPFLISKARIIVAVSEATKRDILHFLHCDSKKVRVIYNGYDHQRYNLPDHPTSRILQKFGLRRYFLAIGPTYPHKNFEVLLSAYASLPETIRHQYPLVIAGGKIPYITILKKRVEALNLQAQVTFLGYVSIELMPSLYREAFTLVFPSLYEGFGFPLLEAMACGCPVISSNTSSMPEIGESALMYFDPYNKEALTSCMMKMISEGSIRDWHIKKGLEQAVKFSWQKTASEWKSLLDLNCKNQNN